MSHSASCRLVALVLVVVLGIVAATPAKAEADPTVIIALVGLAVVGLVLIAYLIIANVEGDKRAGEGRTVWLACAEEGCRVIPAPVTPPAPAVAAPQGL